MGIGKIFKGVKNIVLGKKDPGKKGGYLELDPELRRMQTKARAAQSQGLEIYKSELANLGQMDAKSAALREQARRIKLAKAAGEDQKAKTREMLARSGSQRSASGMRALMGAENQALESVRGIRADMPQIMQEQQMNRINRLRGLTSGVNQTAQSTGEKRAYMKGRESRGRGGGLLGVGLGIAGAYASAKKGGDPAAGFSAGANAGKMMANM